MTEYLDYLSNVACLALLTNLQSIFIVGLLIYYGVYLFISSLGYLLESFVKIYLVSLSKLFCLFYKLVFGRCLGALSKKRKNNKNICVDERKSVFEDISSQESSTPIQHIESDHSNQFEEAKITDEMSREEQILKEYQKRAYHYINDALSIDETCENVESKLKALPLYQKGIAELIKGINLDILGEGAGFDRARNLKKKMQSNLSMVEERMMELEKLKQSPSSNHLTYKSVNSLDASKPSINSQTYSGVTPNKTPITKRVNSPGRSMLPRAASTIQNRTGASKITLSSRPSAKTTSEKLASLKNVDKKMLDLILNEISDHSCNIKLSDVAGQLGAKEALYEMVLLPSLRPELFTGLRSPAKGLLLFGPPGNGKTMLAQAVAHESGWVFFNISAASLTSRWMGEGEKLVRALFAAAKHIQKAIIFIDEIDSLFSERKEGEHEASRRMKTQFMVEFSQVDNEQIIVIGATNRPSDLDDAVLRRFPKRIYIPMPDLKTRRALLDKLLQKQASSISSRDMDTIAGLTEGYSASDLTSLAKDAAMGPIRELGHNQIKQVEASKLRDINLNDFRDSLRRIRPSVPKETLVQLEKWNRDFGDTTTH